MLILTRRVNETVCIGDNIRITVTKVTNGQVSLGIEAPREIPVHREEIRNRIRQQEKVQEFSESERREPREPKVCPQTGFDDD